MPLHVVEILCPVTHLSTSPPQHSASTECDTKWTYVTTAPQSTIHLAPISRILYETEEHRRQPGQPGQLSHNYMFKPQHTELLKPLQLCLLFFEGVFFASISYRRHSCSRRVRANADEGIPGVEVFSSGDVPLHNLEVSAWHKQHFSEQSSLALVLRKEGGKLKSCVYENHIFFRFQWNIFASPFWPSNRLANICPISCS